MYRNLLLATDGSELAENAVVQGLSLAKHLKAKVMVITVTPPCPARPYGAALTPALIDLYEKASADNAARILSSSSEAAKKVGVACAVLHVKDQYPAEAIIAAAKHHGCDLIVIASHGRGAVGRLFLGSEALEVLRLSTVPVLICRIMQQTHHGMKIT